MYEEANGDISERKLNENIDKINATYIYEGEAFCHLKYKDRIIKTIPVECRKTGWRKERKYFGFFRWSRLTMIRDM